MGRRNRWVLVGPTLAAIGFGASCNPRALDIGDDGAGGSDASALGPGSSDGGPQSAGGGASGSGSDATDGTVELSPGGSAGINPAASAGAGGDATDSTGEPSSSGAGGMEPRESVGGAGGAPSSSGFGGAGGDAWSDGTVVDRETYYKNVDYMFVGCFIGPQYAGEPLDALRFRISSSYGDDRRFEVCIHRLGIRTEEGISEFEWNDDLALDPASEGNLELGASGRWAVAVGAGSEADLSVAEDGSVCATGTAAMIRAADGSECGDSAWLPPCDEDAYWGAALQLQFEPPWTPSMDARVVYDYSVKVTGGFNRPTFLNLRAGGLDYCDTGD